MIRIPVSIIYSSYLSRKEDIDASNIIIIDGLYNMAMIYKDKLEDIPYLSRAFENLERRFPDNEHRLESYYQVYLMALKTGNTALATEYKNKLMNAFRKVIMR